MSYDYAWLCQFLQSPHQHHSLEATGTSKTETSPTGQSATLDTAVEGSIFQHGPIAKAAAPLDCTTKPEQEGWLLKDGNLVVAMEADGRAFLFDDASSWDISKELNYHRTWSRSEPKVHQLIGALVKFGCTPSKLFLDVGANGGYYSLLAAAAGCAVLAFDPQVRCAELINNNVCVNKKFHPKISVTRFGIVNHPVSDGKGNLTLEHANTCLTTFTVEKQAATASSEVHRAGNSFTRELVSLDELLYGSKLEVLLAKIDVEAHELQVLRSARNLLHSGQVKHLIVEVSPGLYEDLGKSPREELYQEFLELLHKGCTIQRVLDVHIHANGTISKQRAIDTPEALHAYLVLREYFQEDVFVTC